MDEQNNIDNNIDTGLPQEAAPESGRIRSKEELVGALHKSTVLPQLRTYQGDVAKFIKEKDQSVVTIALKEKERREQREAVEKNEQKEKEKSAGKPFLPKINFNVRLMPLLLGLVLIVGSASVVVYIFYFQNIREPAEQQTVYSIIKADEEVVLDASGLGATSLRETINSVKVRLPKDEVVEIKITDSGEKKSLSAAEFTERAGFGTPAALARSLDPEFMLGVYGDGAGGSLFLILMENDYGIAFRDMLEWEPQLFSKMKSILSVSTSTTASASFKDLILSNKDTRAVSDTKGKIVFIYTFLDKNTILLTESESAFKSILGLYSARNFVR